ncbi:MAG: type II toxin-antitoxin system HipA family toxin YjjJ [Deltaproteobacteria bacterium]|nr:type II toxin-antitoxin system HipA family toxin YjjJ [Deltaproteobacteria bacterium]
MALEHCLAANGPAKAKEIYRHLGWSQPVFSRMIHQLGTRVLIAGQARATLYALKREVPHVGFEVPIHAIDSSSRTIDWGRLWPVYPKGFYFESHRPSVESRYFDDLPYFLDDLRPSGFLGRLIPKHYPDMPFPEDIRHWSLNDILLYWTQVGWDLIGNFILGEKAYRLYLKNNSPRPAKTSYAKLAERILESGYGGSSAAGEQPKFLTTNARGKSVLVKFSPPMTNKISRRLADLLICEHIAHQTLKKAGLPAMPSAIRKQGNRLFLEMERFDRTPLSGRLGLISLAPLSAEFVGTMESWSHSAQELVRQNRIDPETGKQIQWLEWFGKLIGNTDMHFGNISLFMEDLHLAGLAPAYDMLPMVYAPRHQQFDSTPIDFPLPMPDETKIYILAKKEAVHFWREVGRCKSISREFRSIASKNLKGLT